MSNGLVLEAEGRSPVQGPDWANVETIVANLGSRGCGYTTLSNSTGYVQAAGARPRMIVEYRELNRDGTFHHYVLGKSPTSEPKRTSINSSSGIIQLNSNEVLSAKSALEIFRSFFDHKVVPSNYTRRDITALFLEGTK
jgi:hypothetical protein